jgi:hypothetical protein
MGWLRKEHGLDARGGSEEDLREMLASWRDGPDADDEDAGEEISP